MNRPNMMYHIILLIHMILARRNDSVILILCRNSDKNGMKKTLKNFEHQFNRHHHYPYLFLNDKDWEDDFKQEIGTVISGAAEYGKIPEDDWNMPANINRDKAKMCWEKMKEGGVPYADVESYHNMCRFFSRKFFRHPLTKKYKYYWRVEPDVRFRCPIEEDPFEVMEKNGYQYGFTIALRDYLQSIPTLWQSTAEFREKNKSRMAKNNVKLLKFMFNKDGSYNTCHFWSNFEIASFEFLRSDLYKDYVEYLESEGGFYYERWGDAPVHSLAVALFMDKKKVHFFEKIGYTHDGITHCPSNNSKCDCKPVNSFDFKYGSCLSLYLDDQMNRLEIK